MVSPVIIAVVAFVCCICLAVGIYFATKKEDSPVSSPASGSSGIPAAPATLTPLQTLLASAKAIQVPAVDPATLSGTWSAAITPIDPTGPTIKYSFTMDVNLDSTWSTVAGSTYAVFTHAGGSPSFYINNGGAAGATWWQKNGVLIYQATVGGTGGQLVQVYADSFAPGTGYKNITVVCDGTAVNYYVNGVLATVTNGSSVNTTGVKWNSGAWAWAGMVEAGGVPKPTGKSKIRNFYWWSNKALSDDERTTLLGNAATAGSLGASTYMPEPIGYDKSESEN